MDRIIDFIKTFKLSLFGLDTWDLWIGFGIIILIFVFANWLTSFLQPTTGQRIKKILTIVFYSVFFGVMILIILNSLLTENYDRLTVMVFVLIIPYLKRWMEEFYKRYDRFVDRITDK
jgi:cytochrome b561